MANLHHSPTIGARPRGGRRSPAPAVVQVSRSWKRRQVSWQRRGEVSDGQAFVKTDHSLQRRCSSRATPSGQLKRDTSLSLCVVDRCGFARLAVAVVQEQVLWFTL